MRQYLKFLVVAVLVAIAAVVGSPGGGGAEGGIPWNW